MKILFVDSTHPLLEKELAEAGHELHFDYQSSASDIEQIIGNFDGLIIRSRFPVNRAFLSHTNKLKFIGRFGAGLENIDVPFAESLGIRCIRVPEGNRDAVGEHAIGMLLSLFNHLKRADTEVRQGIWRRKENTGLELSGKTVGVIGYGHMGEAFVEKLQGFNVRILIYDKYKSQYAPDFAFETGLNAIFEEADILSLHVPLTQETKYMVNRDFIMQFRKPFYLINTARGEVVKTADLVTALQSSKVLGACLDVLEYEQRSFETAFAEGDMPEPLKYMVASEKVILSPHIAGWSQESFEKMAQTMAWKISGL